MKAHLDSHTERLSLKNYFIEPRILTQPSALSCTIKFKFSDPGVPCVYYKLVPILIAIKSSLQL